MTDRENWNTQIDPLIIQAQKEWFVSETPEDLKLYEKIRDGLPDNEGSAVVGASCAHCMKIFRMFVGFVKPQALLEIGFNLGYSSRAFLELGVPIVTSIEIRKSEDINRSREFISKKYPKRFNLYDGVDISKINNLANYGYYNAAFIDGSHNLADIAVDIEYCMKFGVKTILMDDFWPHFGDTQKAILQTKIKVVAILGNFAICEL